MPHFTSLNHTPLPRKGNYTFKVSLLNSFIHYWSLHRSEHTSLSMLFLLSFPLYYCDHFVTVPLVPFASLCMSSYESSHFSEFLISHSAIIFHCLHAGTAFLLLMGTSTLFTILGYSVIKNETKIVRDKF